MLESQGFPLVQPEYPHLTGTRFPTLSIRTRRLPAWLGWFCVAVLLLATTAQAAHVCCTLLAPTQNHTQQVTSSATAPRVCLLCLMAGSISIAVAVVATVVGSSNRARIRSPQTRPDSFLGPFALYVRPPPAY